MPEEPKLDDKSAEKSQAIAEQNATIGHNRMSQPEFLSYIARHIAIEEKQEELRKAKNLMRRGMKNVGIDCGLFDQARKEMDISPEVLAENQTKISMYRHLAGLAPNEQGDFIAAQEAAAKETGEERMASIKLRAFVDATSMRGKTSDENPYDGGTQEAEHWQDGWMEGQKALAKQLKADGVQLGA